MKKDETLDANGLGEGAKSNGKENDSESSTSQTKNATDDDESSPKLGSLSATLSILAYFSLVIYLYLICKQNKCLFKDISQFSSSDLIDLYNPFVSLCVEGFYLTVLLFSMLPFGKFFEIEGAQRTRHNGTAIASLTFIAVLALKYYFKVSASAILEHVPQFIIPTFVVGFVAAVFVAFKSRGEVSEGGLLHHFVMGSSQQVSLGGVNVKIWIHRSLFLALFVLNYLTIEAGIEKGEALSPTLALTAGMQIVFATEAILNERFVLLSLEFNNIKIGWMYLTTLAYPFMSYLTTRSILISG